MDGGIDVFPGRDNRRPVDCLLPSSTVVQKQHYSPACAGGMVPNSTTHLHARDGPKHALEPGQRFGHEEEGRRVPVHDALPEADVELEGQHVVLERQELERQLAQGEVPQDTLWNTSGGVVCR